LLGKYLSNKDNSSFATCPNNFDKKLQELSEISIEGINTRMLVKE
jgi:hypothetical protein